MFASHFARAKASQQKKSLSQQADEQQKRTTAASEVRKTKRKDPPSLGHKRAKDETSNKKKKSQNDDRTKSEEEKKSRKRRRQGQREPRRVRPTPEALDLSRQLQDLSRQKKLKELTDIFWKDEYAKFRDNHHVCIVVDCCSRCGDVALAEKVVDSLAKGSVTVETKTALLKCYAHSGDLFKAMNLFRDMCQSKNSYQRPNVRTLNTLLRGCLWTAATEVLDNGNTHVVGGVVSSEEAWNLFQNLSGDEQHPFDTSSYEVAVILLCQALRVEEAQDRIDKLQTQYAIKCKGKASIKGGEQGSLETCGIGYLGLARAWALLGRTDDMWIACQRCLHAVHASRAKLERESQSSSGTQPQSSGNKGGKRGWKHDASEDGQKRAASNLAYRQHRLNEVENEARSLLKRRNSAEHLSPASIAELIRTKLLYFAGGGNTNGSSATGKENVSWAAPWYGFGLKRVVSDEKLPNVNGEERNCDILSKEGRINLSRIFSKKMKNNPVDIEIGSGFGDWIVRQALAFPDRNHFAVELRADRVHQIFCRGTLTSTNPLDNLCAVGGDAASFLRDRIGKTMINSVFANHPEPPTQTLGQNIHDLEGLMANETEPAHMLNSVTLGWAADCLVKGGRIVIVTDNRNFGNLICATFVRLARRKKHVLRCLDSAGAKKMKFKPIETFPEGIALYEGQPSLQIGHAREEMLAGQSYFDRLWKTGAGRHSDASRRYIVVMYKR